jgi:hypothetical protein
MQKGYLNLNEFADDLARCFDLTKLQDRQATHFAARLCS